MSDHDDNLEDERFFVPNPDAPSEGKRSSLHQAGGKITTEGVPGAAELLRAAWEGAEIAPTDGLTHGFHAYPGRMFPFVAAQVIQGFSSPGGAVVDPFVGSGTVLVEGMAAGRAAAGVDINAIALRIAWARTRCWGAESIEELRALSQKISDDAFKRARKKISQRPNEAARTVARWYDPHVMQELLTLWNLIREVKDRELRQLCEMIFSSLVVKVSHRASETDPRFKRRTVGRGSTSRLFGEKGHLLSDGLAALAQVVPEGTPPIHIERQDAREVTWLGEGVAELVLTSPPYAGTYDYEDHQSLRYPWFGEAPPEGEIGARRNAPLRWQDAFVGWQRQERSYLGPIATLLRPGGHLVAVVGDSALAGRALRANKCLMESADAVGLRFVASASQERPAPRGPAGEVFAEEPRREHLVAFVKN